MIKDIGKFIARDFMENTIEKNKDTNIYANLANHSLSIFDIIANFSKYIIFVLLVISVFNIIVPILLYSLFGSILLTIFGFMLSNITTIVMLNKLIKTTKREVFNQISNTIKLVKV